VKSVRTECLDHLLVSTKLVCVAPYQGMPRISIVGARTGHLVNARSASPLCISFDFEWPTARSRPSLCRLHHIYTLLPGGLYLRPSPGYAGRAYTSPRF
jgi:hypothetical protein